MIDISTETNKRVLAQFSADEHQVVLNILLNECGDNLPLIDPSFVQLVERIRFAVIKLSQGELDELNKWVGLAKKDWRDVLVAAGFGSGIEDHLDWWPDLTRHQSEL
jgi:hypothetical protein